jgi:hypothetical protein
MHRANVKRLLQVCTGSLYCKAVLAYTYFHLAGVAQAEGQTPLSREYAQKNLALAERHKLAELRAEAEAFLKQKR